MGLKKEKKLFQQARRKLITNDNPRSPISEQFRTIRTNIQFSSVDKELRTIMVTSSVPGEGKSTAAANMAVVFAQQGREVLLVDADLRKPTVHYTFDLINTFGLTSVLSQKSSLAEAAKKTEIDHLSVLPSGPLPPNPAEMLDSKAMREFMDEAADKYELIIFDTPPVLAVTDAQVLSNVCDGIVLVVSSGSTEVAAAKKAKELLVSAKSNIIGTILNRRKMKSENYYYYYGT